MECCPWFPKDSCVDMEIWDKVGEVSTFTCMTMGMVLNRSFKKWSEKSFVLMLLFVHFSKREFCLYQSYSLGDPTKENLNYRFIYLEVVQLPLQAHCINTKATLPFLRCFHQSCFWQQYYPFSYLVAVKYGCQLLGCHGSFVFEKVSLVLSTSMSHHFPFGLE
ncbi:Endogenous retrovirus group K member 5 Gag polyprotein [Manis javanica]|nr:Endogenous retrovirus group K member 5 Gag polyprotein [Manis javanica]